MNHHMFHLKCTCWMARQEHVCCPECPELSWGPQLTVTDIQLMFWMTMSQWAVTPHSGKTKSPTSLKGELCEGGIQFHLPFSSRPPGTQEWKKRDWEGKKAKEIEIYRGEMCAGWGGLVLEQAEMNAWTSIGRKQQEEERWWEYRGFSPLHSPPLPLWLCSGYLLWPLLSWWDGREMGS